MSISPSSSLHKRPDIDLEEEIFDQMDPSFQDLIRDVLRDQTGILEEVFRYHCQHTLDITEVWDKAVIGG